MLHQPAIISGRIGLVLVHADIDADQTGGARLGFKKALQIGFEFLETGAGETHAVDHRLVYQTANDAGLRIFRFAASA